VTSAAPSTESNELVQIFGRTVQYKWIVAVVYASALFLDILDSTIVNVALPMMGEELRTTDVEWVVLGYTLSLAVWIPTSGWLGDRFGTKRVFMFALGAFTMGSLLCGMAQTIGQLIAFRVVQGVGGGMLAPVGIAMLFRSFPPAERAKASTVVMVPTLIAPALGPVIGGFITEKFDWRWIFLVNVPVAIVALWFGHRFLREHREPTAGGFDAPGFVFSAGALALLVFALSEGPRKGWTSNEVLLAAGIGALCAVATAWWELRVPDPMLDLRLLGNRLFRQCSLVSFFSMASFLGGTFIMPLYLQNLRGMQPFESGLTTFPQALGVMVSSVIAGRLYMTVGPRRLMTGAFVGAAITIVWFTRLTLGTDLWLIRGMMLFRGLCMGFAFVPMQAAAYATITPAQNGRASSLFSTQRQVGVSFGIAILASILASYGALAHNIAPQDMDDALSGMRWAFGAAVAMALVAAAFAARIRDEDARNTMVARR